MKPTFPGAGSLWVAHACTQSIALRSMHIGSGPGVVGLSGMQVKLPVPWRTVRMVPSAAMTTMVAFSATALGAAVIALAITFLSDIAAAAGLIAEPGVMVLSAEAASETDIKDAPTTAQRKYVCLCISLLPLDTLVERLANEPPA